MTFLTGAHSGLGRVRPEARSADERVSLTTVIEAIADIMGDYNRFGIVDRALAARIGGEVQTAVAAAIGSGRISSTTQLTSQQAFWSILSQHLASTSSAHTDEQARRAFLHHVRTQANRTGADFANFVAQFHGGAGYADRGSDGDGSVLLTSARFDAFSGSDGAYLTSMRSYAMEQGLHWAANRPDILRLGPEAIRLFARLGFSQQSHDRLHQAGFNHHDMHHIARYAERNGIDVNDLATHVARSPEIFGAGNADRTREWTERFRNYFARPESEEARRDMGRALDEMERDGTEAQRDHVRRLRPLLRLEAQATTHLDARLTVDNAQTQLIAGQGQQIEDGLGELNGPTPVRVDRAEVVPPRGSTLTTATAHQVQQPRLAT